MSFVSLPTIAEAQFASYISANLTTGTYQQATPDGTVTGSYSVAKGFSIEPYELPLVLVKAGKFSETEPWAGVYDGSLAVSVITQIDDTEDPVALHDTTMAEVYDLLANQSAVATAVNAANFHLWGYYVTSYDQDVSEGDNKRALVSTLELKIHCQTAAA